ncbi:MAG: AarF/UbiB family protein [Myxococcota bacterium]|jgi:ubiquinone biosynthesis protein|nr:AarF/UbiB family protein [Myxococcota bacterium]
MQSSALKARKPGIIRGAVNDISRLGRISAVLAKHGFGALFQGTGLSPRSPADKSPEELAENPSDTARRLRLVLEELGPTFVKLGQVLSTRPDLLPAAFILELAKLQDQSPPLDFEQIRAQVEDALGCELSSSFSEFHVEPLATGSIAQTHLAVTSDGVQVVVKVQRPGLDELIRSDLDLLRLLARFLEATIEEMSLYSPTGIVDEFELALLDELDFRVEAAHIRTFREQYAQQQDLWIPRVFEALSRRQVLVLERIVGVKITDIEPGSERGQRLALRLVELAYSMMFEHGVFHGDPHPGNLIACTDGRLGLIDFGLIGRLTQQQQDALMSLVISVASGDIDGVARAIMQIGRPLGRVPLREMREDIITIRNRYLRGSLEEVDVSALVMELLEAGQRHRIRIPPEYAILTKAAVSLEGIIRHLHPDIDIPSALSPYSRRLLIQRYGPQRLAPSLLNGALNAGSIMHDLPLQLTQFFMDLEYEGVRVHVDNPGLNELKSSLSNVALRLVMGMTASALILGAFLSMEGGSPTGWSYLAFLGALSILGVLLLWHALEGRIRKIRISPWVKVKRKRRE